MPRKPKATQAAEAAMPDAPRMPARRGRPPRAKIAPAPTEAENSPPSISARDGDATTGPNDYALMPEPVDAGGAVAETKPMPAPSPAKAAAAPSKPAAQWDPAADTVQFDWPEIEQTASRPGPNQVMAKLLVAARAEGANSRGPFVAAGPGGAPRLRRHPSRRSGGPGPDEARPPPLSHPAAVTGARVPGNGRPWVRTWQAGPAWRRGT